MKFKKERKVPQIGWNRVNLKTQMSNAKTLFKDVQDNSYFYFVNSYYCIPEDESEVAGETEYGEKFASIVMKNNIAATQFHPEKSGQIGMFFLENWSRL